MGKLRIIVGLVTIGLVTLLWKVVLIGLIIGIPVLLTIGFIKRNTQYGGKWN